MDKSKRIRELNDAFRKSGLGGMVVMTRAVAGLEESEKREVIVALKAFDNFTADNDPYGEHDFGLLEIGEHKLYWKIDYYSPDMRGGSSDASDPEQTRRVLTIMFCDEY